MFLGKYLATQLLVYIGDSTLLEYVGAILEVVVLCFSY